MWSGIKGIMRFYCFLFLLGIHYTSAAQRILFKENANDATGNYVFTKVINSAIQRSNCSTDLALSTGSIKMSRWASSPSGEIIWTNGTTIYKYNFETQRNTLIADHLEIVLELATSDKFVYLVTNPNGSEGRFSSGSKLIKINLITLKKEFLPVPANTNFTNLSVAADGNTLAFINTSHHGDETLTEYSLMTYNVVTKKAATIDKAKKANDEYFGSSEKYNSSFWMDSNRLLYYKHPKDKINGSIFYYDLNSKTSTAWLQTIPDKNFTWFSYSDQWFYFSDDKCIYKTKDGISKEVVYKQNVQQAVLVRQ